MPFSRKSCTIKSVVPGELIGDYGAVMSALYEPGLSQPPPDNGRDKTKERGDSMREFIWLEPVYKEMIWGSETWTISAHPHGDCRVSSGEFQGKTLSRLWQERPELFQAEAGKAFPLLIKIIDAREDLSIQVHPDDAYAKIHENGSLGKTECWYILDCKEDASIVIGHRAKDQETLRRMIEEKRWDEWIREIPIKKGDFFQINPGCVHAVKGGTLILETQQNSDVTYRVYDYDRIKDGQARELHIRQSLDVIQAPFKEADTKRRTWKLDGAQWTRLVECNYYEVDKVDTEGPFTHEFQGPFTNVSIIAGNGVIDGNQVKQGDHFIIPHGYGSCRFEGKMSLICSVPVV